MSLTSYRAAPPRVMLERRVFPVFILPVPEGLALFGSAGAAPARVIGFVPVEGYQSKRAA